MLLAKRFHQNHQAVLAAVSINGFKMLLLFIMAFNFMPDGSSGLEIKGWREPSSLEFSWGFLNFLQGAQRCTDFYY